MTLAGTLATSTPATSSTAEGTPLGGVGASTPSTTGVSPQSPRAPGCLAGRSELHLFPPRFRQPNTLIKYSGETDPAVWLNDYHLACQLGGATEDAVIIRNLPLHLADATRTWLEHLPADQIHNWADLVHIFVGNFQGTYVRPGNSWDLKGCHQKPRESMRDYVRQMTP